MGKDEQEFVRPLFALPMGHDLPHLTAPQQRLLDCTAPEAYLIDRAFRKLDNWPLQGEVQRFRTLWAQVAVMHDAILHLRRDLSTSTQELQESIDRLSQSDAYRRLQQVLEDEDDQFQWLAAADLRATLQKTTSRPIEPADDYCRWCQRIGHAEADCWVFCTCHFCERYGHIAADCRTPHRLCSPDSGCKVPADHSNYQRDCWARPYFIDNTGNALRLTPGGTAFETWADLDP